MIVDTEQSVLDGSSGSLSGGNDFGGNNELGSICDRLVFLDYVGGLAIVDKPLKMKDEDGRESLDKDLFGRVDVALADFRVVREYLGLVQCLQGVDNRPDVGRLDIELKRLVRFKSD